MSQQINGFWSMGWHKLKQDRAGMTGLMIVALFLIISLGVWLNVWGQGWSETSGEFNALPSWNHWLGTNAIGQDIASRGFYATKVAFEVGLVVTVAALLLGLLAGTLSGFKANSWLDGVILWLMGVLDSIPFYLFVAAVAYAMKQHFLAMHLAMIMVFWTSIARVIRSEVIRLKNLEFIDAGEALGLSRFRLIISHLIPNTSHLLLVQGTLVFVAAIKTEVILSFLGLGIKEGISWGLMIAESTNDIQAGHFSNFITASGLLFILVMGFNLLSDALQDALDPKSLR
jgi:ABC-type dipeptide/oligopeptide/nickel transport system permease subunit